jgi:hypothetical protein
LRLRGLPFTCSEQEVFAFFSKHDVVEHIADVDKAVQFLTKPNGKPSGQATVQMSSKEHADIAQAALNGQWIGARYIEVYPYQPEDTAEDRVRDDASGFNGAPSVLTVGGEKGFSEQEPDVPSAGDTGGSSSPSPPGNMAGAPFMQPGNPWAAGRGLEFMAMMQQMQQGAGMPPGMPLPPHPIIEGGAGTGDGSAQNPMRGGDAGSWEALFDFLKRDGGVPPTDGNPAHVHVNPV